MISFVYSNAKYVNTKAITEKKDSKAENAIFVLQALQNFKA